MWKLVTTKEAETVKVWKDVEEANKEFEQDEWKIESSAPVRTNLKGLGRFDLLEYRLRRTIQ